MRAVFFKQPTKPVRQSIFASMAHAEKYLDGLSAILMP